MKKLRYSLHDLYLFHVVAEKESFSAAAAALGLSKSVVSRRVSCLESDIGSRLIQRTSRSLALTDAGRTLLQYSHKAIDAAFDGDNAISNVSNEVSGSVRISVPTEIGHTIISEVVARFLETHPKVKLEVVVSNNIVNIIEDGFDLVIRGGNLALPKDSSIVSVRLLNSDWALLCSPKYQSRIGDVSDITHLADLDFLAYSSSDRASGPLRFFNAAGECANVSVKLRLVSNSHTLLKNTAILGLGICNLPYFACKTALATNELVRVFPGWSFISGSVYALYPTRRGMSASTRALLDYMIEYCRNYSDFAEFSQKQNPDET